MSDPMPRRFTKMSGAGNDFLVFGGKTPPDPALGRTIRALCRRGTGVGADGVLFVHVEETGDGPARVVADYYNADGGSARFCANGTRCAARFAQLHQGAGHDLDVETGWGVVGATVHGDGFVTLELPEPIAPGSEVSTFDEGGKVLEPLAEALQVGVPHLVPFLAEGVDLETLELPALGPRLRHHPGLPDGANVTFTRVTGPSSLAVRSFERGVEAETLCCGSGVVAAATVAARRRGLVPPIRVVTRSGSVLTVGLRLEGDRACDVTLTGDARVVFEGTLAEDPQ